MTQGFWEQYRKILPNVTTPGQYIGNEWNAVVKGKDFAGTRVALVFPDTYAVGMSHYGYHLLYSILNEEGDIACERAFVPWTDMEAAMRERRLPLLSLESHRPLIEFDVVGFSLQYEMCYTNLLTALDLAGIPLKRVDREDCHPVVIAGGPCAFAPEPLADFVDLFFIGEADDHIAPLVKLIGNMLRDGADRDQIIQTASTQIPGVYAPSLYRFRYSDDNTIGSIESSVGTSNRVRTVLVENFEEAVYCRRPIVPNVEVVHDRINLEIMRGCPHRCKFCQSGTIKGRVRVRSVDKLLEIAKENYAATGYNEISLLSLSTTDYPWLDELLSRLNAEFEPLKVSVSVPSLRVDSKVTKLPKLLSVVRKSGVTLAPEAATERLRSVIGKDIDEETLLETARVVYGQGWNVLKLYFMVGLPTETDEDVLEIPELARRVSISGKAVGRGAGQVNVSISPFVPKAHTPFQWEAMASMERISEVRELIFSRLRNPRIRVKFSDPRRSFLEAVLARGDRRIGNVIEEAWREGARMDAWTETFNFDCWQRAFEKCGIDPNFYVLRLRRADEILPWDHIDACVSKEQLMRERPGK